jgi:predicted nucleic acid-binding Zn ribbon protein
LSDCPACDKAELTKLVSAAGFRLKGSGWYETDFKNSGKKVDAKPSPACGTGACPAVASD